MVNYNVSIPNDKTSFFKEFLKLIGAKYTEETGFELSEEQRQILHEQNEVPIEDCIDSDDFYKLLNEKYEL